MAFPLKSGADLYNQQLIRAAIWNHGADPSETVTGLLYFNTSNSSAAKKLRLYTGSVWKTIAFEEDLDVANNAEFQTLKRKVEAFLEGGVDSDGVLNKLSEIQAFLDNYSSATDLTEILDTKLNKIGGTIGKGNSNSFPLTISSTSSYTGFTIETSEGMAYFRYQGGSKWGVTDVGWKNSYTLIHSGNFNEQGQSLARGTWKIRLGGETQWAYDSYCIQYISGQFEVSTTPTEHKAYIGASDNVYTLSVPMLDGSSTTQNLSIMRLNFNGNYFKEICALPNKNALYFRHYANGKSNAWREFAFTDSNVASAQALVHSNGAVGATVRDYGAISISEYLILKNNRYYAARLNDGTTERNILGINSANNLLVGYGTRWDGKTLIYGDGIECIIKDASAFFINSSGNVGIGITNPQHKLHVGGDIVANGTIACKGIAAEGDAMDMVDKAVLYIAPSTTQQTFTLKHGLGTREIAISIYEITSMGTNMILTDVEIVDDNNISVSFGNPPTENHMVVVMG